ncbi:MAG TPA: FkbM family methyltransferase [Acetobacteraceae bacterium]|jgi:FkbM family methyltransferase
MAVLTINMEFAHRQASMVLDLDPTLDRTVLGFLTHRVMYEPDVAHVMLRAVQDGDVAVDVGANVGYFTVLLATLAGPHGRVVSFEPGADNLARLERNIAVSGKENITVVTQPASDVAGPTRFYLNADASGGHALWDPGRFPGNAKSAAQVRAVDVVATTLDDEVARLGLPPPKLIKIDTEGAEHRVLKGATGLLRERRVRYIIAELHDFGLDQLGSSQQDLRGFMAQFGYATFGLYYDGSLPKLIPPDTVLEPRQIVNLLFSTVEDVGRLWQVERFDPLVARQAAQRTA